MNKKRYIKTLKNLLPVLPASDKLHSLVNKAMKAGEEPGNSMYKIIDEKYLPEVLACASIIFLNEKLEQVISENSDDFVKALEKAYGIYVDARRLRYSEDLNFKLLRAFGITTYKCYYSNCPEEHIHYQFRKTPKTKEELESQVEKILSGYHDVLKTAYMVPENILKELTLEIAVVGVEVE